MTVAMAQEPLQFSFTHYSAASGLLSNQVNTIVQDREGYLWMGTTDGLQRFDGVRYKSFQRKENDSSSIPSNPVWQLLVDSNDRLWVLLANGKVGVFDTRKFKFTEVPARFKKPVSPDTYVKRLIKDEYGHIFYLMSGSEIITWDEKSGDFSYKHNFFRQKDEWDILDLIQEPGTYKYWMSIRHTGMAVYNHGTGQLSYPGQNIEKETLVQKFSGANDYDKLSFDRQHRFWCIETKRSRVIYCYDLKSSVLTVEKAVFKDPMNANHEIQGFFQQSDSTVWLYGLLVFAKFHETENQFQFVNNGYQHEKSIAYEYIHCLFEDREKNIWVCTDNNGLYRFNPDTEFFTNIKHNSQLNGKPGEAAPKSFVVTKWGTILAATAGDGLYQYDKNFHSIPLQLNGLRKNEGLRDWCLAASADSNTIWVSSDTGIYAIDETSHTCKHYTSPVLGNKSIRQIAEDKNGNLWIGTQNNGVFKWKSASGKNRTARDITSFAGIPEVPVNKINVDSRGRVWIATPETGLYLVDPESNKIIAHFDDNPDNPFRLPEGGVSSVLEYDDSTVIITTATRIAIFNPVSGKIKVIGSAALISGFIAATEKDKSGWIWLGSTNGFYRINIRKRIFLYFNRSDGIGNEHFTQSASYRLPDGRMLFGTTNQFIAFDPSRIPVRSATPDIRITDFKVMNKSLSLDSIEQLRQIELGYQENSVVIEFSPLVYSNPYLIKYKLEGLDKDWRLADKNYQAIYSYLPAGKYTFLLKTIDEEKNESVKSTQLNIEVRAAFWKTTWFYSLLILAAAGLLFWLDRERMRRKEVIQKMRRDIADNLHQEINLALGNINILSEMANLKADREPEKSKEYIEQIHNRSHNMITAMDDMLWSIKPENDNMAKAIERISEHIDSLRNRYGITINLLIDKKAPSLKLNMLMRRNIFWLLKSGSTNIIRSGATDCNIHIWIQKQNLVYTIEFNSSQVDKQQLNNILQRQELAKKLEEVNGTIVAELNCARAVVELTVPLV
jgi:ligand-binding sensor domain-containing protein/signal transduction histidine kinase